MLIKIVKSLGCAYGCGEGHRGLSGDRLRIQVSVFELVTYGHVDMPFYYSKHWGKNWEEFDLSLITVSIK